MPSSPIYALGPAIDYVSSLAVYGIVIKIIAYPIYAALLCLQWAINFSRFSWVAAHLVQFIWWGSALSLFLNWMWLWILDGLGWVQNDPFDIAMSGKDRGEKGLVDDWVGTNTWTLNLSMQAIETGLGEKFDVENEIHMKML